MWNEKKKVQKAALTDDWNIKAFAYFTLESLNCTLSNRHWMSEMLMVSFVYFNKVII